MRTRAIHSLLHKAQVLYLMPLITSLQVYSSTSLLVLVPLSGLDRAAEKLSLKKRRMGFYFPEHVKIYEQNVLIKEC